MKRRIGIALMVLGAGLLFWGLQVAEPAADGGDGGAQVALAVGAVCLALGAMRLRRC